MHQLKKGIWKAGIALAGLLLLLILTVWVPMSANAQRGASRLAIAAPVQATPTVDLTVTALAKEQLTLQVRQFQNQLQNQNNWFANNSTALIAAVATVIVALFGISQWAINRRDERRKEIAARDKESKDRLEAQDKDLKAQAEERFKTAVTALGDEKEGTQVGGAILLRSFLNKDDKGYERYYAQIFDLAVAYLRPSNDSKPLQYELWNSTQDSTTPLPLTTLRQALIVVFQEAFQLARDNIARNKVGVAQSLETVDDIDIARNIGEAIPSLDATGVQLDNAYLALADLKYVWMRNAFLRNAELSGANLSGALLHGANLSGARLRKTNLSGAILSESNLSGAHLYGANLSGARLRKTNLSGLRLHEVDLSNAYLHKADLSGAHFEDALSLKNADLSGVKGLTQEQLEACKAKGAIIDEDATADSSQLPVPPSPPSQSSDGQAQSAPAAQVSVSPPGTDESSTTSSKPDSGM